jgi:hypothetical protein
LFLKVHVLIAESSLTPKALAPLRARRAESGLAMLLMFASGACGLVWQMVWTAQFGLVLGHEIVALLSVVAAFLAVSRRVLSCWLTVWKAAFTRVAGMPVWKL